jgi:hypothetical protein
MSYNIPLTKKRVVRFLLAITLIASIAFQIKEGIGKCFHQAREAFLSWGIKEQPELQMFFANYEMFSPSQKDFKTWRDKVDKIWGTGTIGFQTKYELWGIREDNGEMLKLDTKLYFPDPRDEVVQLGLRMTDGSLPSTIKNKGITAKTILKEEVIERHNKLFIDARIKDLHIKRTHWAVGENSLWEFWNSPEPLIEWDQL